MHILVGFVIICGQTDKLYTKEDAKQKEVNEL